MSCLTRTNHRRQFTISRWIAEHIESLPGQAQNQELPQPRSKLMGEPLKRLSAIHIILPVAALGIVRAQVEAVFEVGFEIRQEERPSLNAAAVEIPL